MIVYAFSTVSQQEIDKLLSKPHFQNLFKLLKNVSSLPGYPTNWLITSIDYSSTDGKPRVQKNGGNHFDSNAVDIVPLTSKLTIKLPIPLNRNLLLLRTFKSAAIRMNLDPLPIMAFEADHIHCDVNHPGGVAYFNQVRPSFDKKIANLAKSLPFVGSAIDDGQVIYL